MPVIRPKGAKVKGILRDLIVPRVDAVFGPANRRSFLLLKQEVTQMPETNEGAVEVKAELTPEEKEAIKTALVAIYPLYEEGKVPGSVVAALGKLIGYPAPEGLEEEKKPYPYPYPGYKDVMKALERLPNRSEVESLIQQVAKSLEEERKVYVAEIEKSKARIAELEKALELEKEEKESRAFVAEMSSTLDAISARTGEDFIKNLYQIKKSMSGESWTSFVNSMKKLNELLKAVPIMKELGHSIKQEESPEEILAARAKALVEKGLAKTIEQARAKVLEEDKGLYKALRGR